MYHEMLLLCYARVAGALYVVLQTFRHGNAVPKIAVRHTEEDVQPCVDVMAKAIVVIMRLHDFSGPCITSAVICINALCYVRVGLMKENSKRKRGKIDGQGRRQLGVYRTKSLTPPLVECCYAD